MTAIAIWCNNEKLNSPCLWIAADSLISTKNQFTIIDDAAKIMCLPIVCKSPGQNGFFNHIHYYHTIGYCFSGSTLLGQNTFLGLLPLLANLNSRPDFIPSLSEIAKYIFNYLEVVFEDYKKEVGETPKVEAAIFGHCHRKSILSVYHFAPIKIDGTYKIQMRSSKGMKENDFVYLGAHRSEMETLITEGFKGPSMPGKPTSRYPRYIIKEKIEDKKYGAIGGDIQFGTANENGFQLYRLCKPRITGQPEAYFSYLGRELTDKLNTLGSAFIGIPGMV